MKCLVVDDEFSSRKILCDFLSNNFDVDVASNGEEALAAFKIAYDENSPYRLICMDIMMPNMDGKEATRQIRQYETELGIPSAEECNVLMITALDDPKTVFDALYASGATTYIVKPVVRSQLFDALRKMRLLGQEADL